MTTVLVTGGTGTLGRRVVARLAGHDVRVLTRSGEPVAGARPVLGDLTTGAGLAEAVAGVGVVVHAASDPADASRTDVQGTARLLTALADHSPGARLVDVSIVGVEQSDLPYYRAKRAVEQQVADSDLGWDVLRATQFHGFALELLESLTGDDGVVTVPPDIRLQPVAVDEVAEQVVRLALRRPTREIILFGGPQVLGLEEMALAYQRARHVDAGVRLGPADRPPLSAWRSGAQLTPEHAGGRITWQRFLADRFGG